MLPGTRGPLEATRVESAFDTLARCGVEVVFVAVITVFAVVFDVLSKRATFQISHIRYLKHHRLSQRQNIKL